MYHTLDEILKEREEVRKRKERTMRYMAGIPDDDQDNLNALTNDDLELKKLEAMEASGKMMPTAAIERLHFLRRKKAGNSSEAKKSSRNDMLWFIKNSK
jgi:predicted RNase H-like nuclease (RuvC/YqgF family)